jgi:hypothetical protein
MVYIVGTWTVEGGLIRDKSYKPSEMRKLYVIGEMPGHFKCTFGFLERQK